MMNVFRADNLDFDLSVDDELPSGGPSSQNVHYFPGGSQVGGSNGILVHFFPREHQDWFGMFAWGRGSDYSAVIAGPSGGLCFVIAQGAGYLVTVTSREVTDLSMFPIYGAVVAFERGVVVLCDLTSVYAFDSSGLRWHTAKVGFDGVELATVDNDSLIARADAIEGKYELRLDLASGAVLEERRV